MTGKSLSTVIRFNFEDDSFNIKLAAAIKSQGRDRPAIDSSVTETVMAMMSALFHTTNLPLQAQFKRHQLMFKSFLLLFFLITYISLAGALVVALTLCLIYRRLHRKLRDQ